MINETRDVLNPEPTFRYSFDLPVRIQRDVQIVTDFEDPLFGATLTHIHEIRLVILWISEIRQLADRRSNEPRVTVALMNQMINNVLVILATILALFFVFNPKLVQWKIWRAMVTPLASIIGSGFLVLGPILQRDYGIYSIAVIAGLCVVSFSIGAAIRFNILEYDRIQSAGFKTDSIPRGLPAIESTASWVLVFAYVISVAYYMNLFGAFAVKLTTADSEYAGRLVTTGALIFIGTFGYLRGLSAMERMEEVSVGLKLAIIAGLLVGMIAYALDLSLTSELNFNQPQIFGFRSIAIALGLIITVQGFETSRYLGEEYDAQTRVKTMKMAQWTAAVIYIIYISLTTICFPCDQIEFSETAIIDMTRMVAPLLPALLVVAALAAQFSAAVADTSGCGGLAAELSHQRLKSNVVYAVLVMGAIAITWMANIYEIISYASRAFAFYYLLQTVIAIRFAYRRRKCEWRRIVFFVLVAGISLAVVMFGIPAEA